MWQWLVRSVLLAVTLLERLFPQLAPPGRPIRHRSRWRETVEACGLDDIETANDEQLIRATSGTLAVQIEDKVGLGSFARLSVTGIADVSPSGRRARARGSGRRWARATSRSATSPSIARCSPRGRRLSCAPCSTRERGCACGTSLPGA